MMNDSKCSYQNCLKCELSTCMTGQIARELGEAAYNEFLKALDDAEELLNSEPENDEITEYDEQDVFRSQMDNYYNSVIPKDLR